MLDGYGNQIPVHQPITFVLDQKCMEKPVTKFTPWSILLSLCLLDDFVCFIIFFPTYECRRTSLSLGNPCVPYASSRVALNKFVVARSLGGIGEVFNTLGLVLYAINLGTILQSLSLVAFSCFLANRFDGSKRWFLHLYILSSPILLFLITTPKPQLFPQVITALALYFTVSEKKIDKRRFLLICCLLMGAAQQKLSFILTGGVIGLWAFWKAYRDTKLVLVISLMCFVFFFLPRGVWNLEQASNLRLTSFITPLPVEFLDNMHFFRENRFWFPFNLFVPESFGRITATIGFQFLLLFLVRTKNKKFWEVIGSGSLKNF